MSRRPETAFAASVRAFIAEHALLRGGERVLVAVSGGADSCALLMSLVELRVELALTLHGAHLNHGLRAEAGADAACARALCERHGVPCDVGRADVGALQRKLKCSLEHAARLARYEFLEATAREDGAELIALGHTADDQAETMLLNLTRGAGMRGLGGMQPRRERFIRPLLNCRRTDTEAFCRQQGADYRLDATNADPRFARNLIRATVMPPLRRVAAEVVPLLNRAAVILREEDAFLERLANAELDRISFVRGRDLVICGSELNELALALQRRVLRTAVERVQGHRRDVAFEHVEAVLRAARLGGSQSGWTLPGGTRILLRCGSVMVAPPTGLPPARPSRPLPVPGVVELDEVGSRVTATLLQPGEIPCVKLSSVDSVFVDAGAVGPLTVRFSQPGDTFRPFGMSGTKGVRAFLADAKVPRAEREQVPLVVAGDRIVWVVGYRIDERCRVTENTESVLALAASRA